MHGSFGLNHEAARLSQEVMKRIIILADGKFSPGNSAILQS